MLNQTHPSVQHGIVYCDWKQLPRVFGGEESFPAVATQYPFNWRCLGSSPAKSVLCH